MKKLALLIIPVVGLTAYVANAQTMVMPPPQATMQPPAYAQQPVVVKQYCRPYTDSFTIGREKRITRGTACLQPDGAWELHPSQASVKYINRGGAMFIIPNQPFVSVVVEDHHHHRD